MGIGSYGDDFLQDSVRVNMQLQTPNVLLNYEPKVNPTTGSIGNGYVSIDFNYVDPGSWYGPYCDYNSNETMQCSMVILRVSKDSDTLGYDSSITARFEKYQNWSFPWVDEYYTIPLSKDIKVKNLLEIV